MHASEPLPVVNSRNVLGVVLQVEDDSNLLCYGNSFDNDGIIARAMIQAPLENLLVRAHPGSRFSLKRGPIKVDDSPTSADFIRKCSRVMTINSSVGLEALLYDVPVEILGDCSYRFIADAVDAEEKRRRIGFYLYNYLVPISLIFDLQYLRFRLSDPGEKGICVRHLQHYFPKPPADAGAWSALRSPGEWIDHEVSVFSESDIHVRHYSAGVANALPAAKLYYKSGDENYSEDRTISLFPVCQRGIQRARFGIPEGIRPDAVRVEFAGEDGVQVISEVSWQIAGSEADIATIDAIPLKDFGRRVIAYTGRCLSVPGAVPIRLFCQDAKVCLELSVGDLWSSASDKVGFGVLELQFAVQDGRGDVIHVLGEINDHFARFRRDISHYMDSQVSSGVDSTAEQTLMPQALLTSDLLDMDKKVLEGIEALAGQIRSSEDRRSRDESQNAEQDAARLEGVVAAVSRLGTVSSRISSMEEALKHIENECNSLAEGIDAANKEHRIGLERVEAVVEDLRVASRRSFLDKLLQMKDERKG
jgi:hypothetical protein